jgi:type III pantothenate kinase
MILLIDIGNSNITVGLLQDNDIKDILHLKTIEGRSTEEYFYIFNGFISQHQMEKPHGAVVCSVVPEITPLVIDALKKGFEIEPIDVNYKTNTGLKFLIKHPENLGADRIANAVAARRLYKGDIIVVDFGTATTFCVITEKGEYMGGAIMPGVVLSSQILAEKTAKLPLVEPEAPGSIPGTDTEENIRLGVILGHAGAVERIIKEITERLGKDFKIVATGGLTHLIKPYIKKIDYVNPLLTIEGLRFIYELNS